MHKQYAQYERSSTIRKLQKLEDSSVVLSDEQNEEMCAVMEAMQAEELDKLYQEGDQHGVGSLMKTIWLTDKDHQKNRCSWIRTEIVSAQFLCVVFIMYTLASEGRGNRWSMITIRMGE